MNLTAREIETLLLFIRDRKELWDAEALRYGQADPDAIPRKLAKAHAEALE